MSVLRGLIGYDSLAEDISDILIFLPNFSKAVSGNVNQLLLSEKPDYHSMTIDGYYSFERS